jgi:VWFA-related protein
VSESAVPAVPVSRRAFFSLAASLLAAGRLLRGQQPPATFSTDVNVINLLATVRNKQGQVVRDLRKEDFALEEDGRPQTIRYFTQESDLPLTLGLLVDTSGSQRRVLGAERSASYRFFEQVLREDKDMAFVIHFDREVELLQDLTSSRKQLEAALGELESPEGQQQRQPGGWGGGGGRRRPGGGYPGGGHGRGGGTSLFDSVLLASDELMRKQSGRKALIMLSDGVDNSSKISIERAIESAQRADTLVYSVLFADEQAYGGFNRGGFGGPGMGRRGGGRGYPQSRMPAGHLDGKKVLQRLAKETGGGFFEVSKKEPIEKVFQLIEEELRNQYSIGYTSDQPSGSPGFRKIHLTAKANGLIVQTRDGYYAAK